MASSGFEPGSQDAQVPYLPRFIPPRLESAVGSAITGAGQFIKDVAGTADQYIQTSLTSQMRDMTNVVNDATNSMAQFAMNPVGATDAAMKGQPIPDAVTEGMGQAEGMTTAKGMGKLNNTNYWAQMDLIARNLRAAYPGYKDFIDDTMSRLTERGPANSLHKAIDAQLNMMAQGQNDISKKVMDNEKTIAELGRTTPPGYDQLSPQDKWNMSLAIIANAKSYVSRDEDAMSAAKLQTQLGESQKVNQDAQRAKFNMDYTNSVNSKFAFFIENSQNSKDPQQRRFWDTINMLKNGNNIADMPLSQKEGLITNLRMVEPVLTEQLIKPLEAGPLGQNADFETKQRARDYISTYFTKMISGVAGPIPGLLKDADERLAIQKDLAAQTIWNASPSSRILAGIDRIAPQASATIVNLPSFNSDLVNQIAKAQIAGTLTGDVKSAQNAIDTVVGDNGMTQTRDPKAPGVMLRAMRDAAFADGNKPEHIKNALNALYGPANQHGIDSLVAKGASPDASNAIRVDAFTDLHNYNTTDKVVQMYKDGIISAQEYQNYNHNTVSEAAKRIRQDMSVINDVAVRSDTWDLKFDPQSLKLKLVSRKEPIPDNPMNNPDAPYSFDPLYQGAKVADSISRNYQELKANEAITRINRVLDSVQYLSEKTGDKDVPKTMFDLVAKNGVAVGGVKQQPEGAANLYASLVTNLNKMIKEDRATNSNAGIPNALAEPFIP